MDVVPVVAGAGQSEKDEKISGLKIEAWETYRGNDWGNKGEVVGLEGGALRVKVLGPKAFFMERSSCECLSRMEGRCCAVLLTLDHSQCSKHPEEPNDSSRTGQYGPVRWHAVLDGQQ